MPIIDSDTEPRSLLDREAERLQERMRTIVNEFEEETGVRVAEIDLLRSAFPDSPVMEVRAWFTR